LPATIFKYAGIFNENMGDIQVTYETLFELQRMEKERKELQQLDSDFLEQVIMYLKEKEEMMQKQKSVPDLLSFDEEKKGLSQITNIKRMIQEIYELREKKIVQLAINKAKISTSVINPSVFLPSEKQMFDKLVALFNNYRANILNKVLLRQQLVPEPAPVKQQKPESPSKTIETAIKTVRFMHPVPQFMGPDLEQFGPYEPEDIASLPSKVVQTLIAKGRVEEIMQK